MRPTNHRQSIETLRTRTTGLEPGWILVALAVGVVAFAIKGLGL